MRSKKGSRGELGRHVRCWPSEYEFLLKGVRDCLASNHPVRVQFEVLNDLITEKEDFTPAIIRACERAVKAFYYKLPLKEQERVLGDWKPVPWRPTAEQIQDRYNDDYAARCLEMTTDYAGHKFEPEGSSFGVRVLIHEGQFSGHVITALETIIERIRHDWPKLIDGEPEAFGFGEEGKAAKEAAAARIAKLPKLAE